MPRKEYSIGAAVLIPVVTYVPGFVTHVFAHANAYVAQDTAGQNHVVEPLEEIRLSFRD